MRPCYFQAFILSAILSACQSAPVYGTACDAATRAGAVEFVYDRCTWKLTKKEGPDFDLWEITRLNGQRVASIYFGSAPDVRFKKQKEQPKATNVGSVVVLESLDGQGYEALISTRGAVGGASSYVHIFTPLLDASEQDKVKALARSVRFSY